MLGAVSVCEYEYFLSRISDFSFAFFNFLSILVNKNSEDLKYVVEYLFQLQNFNNSGKS